MSEPLGPGWAPKKPPPSGDPEPPPKPRRFWWRFLLAAVLIVGVSAAATSAAGILYVDSIAHDIRPIGPVQRYLKTVEGGEPQNILILGSDKRAGAEFAEDKGRSDTAILVRLDPEKNSISVMSIPRDLKVEIPGHGTGKFNEAYFYGGPPLTLRTVRNLTGLPINHVVNIDFLGFAQAVYAIGCVYTDVDRRYYHSNEGVPPSEQYAEINVKPGYQLMCGKKALQYVRYRHTDTDLVRSARQQDFLSAARQRVSVKDLVVNREEMLDIFTRYTSSDIEDGSTLIELLKLFLSVRNAPIKEVHFPAELGPSFVYTTKAAVDDAVRQFLGGEASGGSRGKLEGRGFGKKAKRGGKKKAKKKRKGKAVRTRRAAPKPKIKLPDRGSDGLVPAREAGEAEAKIALRRAKDWFPIYYPTRLPPNARYVESNPYLKVVDPYVYRIKDESGKRHLAYRMVLVAEMPDGPHYFGVQGIRGWPDPPILESPSLTKKVKGRELEIFVDDDRIKLIAWRRGENSYWITNDLLRSLTNDQMIGMARSVAVLLPKGKPPKRRSAEE